MNLWVRNAIIESGKSQTELAAGLTRSGLGNYDRSMVQKMTVGRRVSMDEARVISQLTGYPMPDPTGGAHLPAGYDKLDPAHQAVVRRLIDELLSLQKDS